MAFVALVLAGCGGGSGGNRAVAVTKWLAPGAESYTMADLESLREDLGLPEDADPLDMAGSEVASSFAASVAPALPAFTTDAPTAEVTVALDLSAVVGAASSSNDAGPSLTVLKTNADTGDIGSALGDLGFSDDAGILRKEGEPNIHLEPGLIFLSTDPAALRSLPEEPLDEPPSPLLDDLDAPVIRTLAPPACVSAIAFAAQADRSGELVYLVEGGDKVTVPVESSGEGTAAIDTALAELPNFDCQR